MFLPQVFLYTSLSIYDDVWHRQLSHPNSWVMSLLASVTYASRSLNFQCPACPLGKSLRLSLGPTGHKTSTLLELIFSDI